MEGVISSLLMFEKCPNIKTCLTSEQLRSLPNTPSSPLEEVSKGQGSAVSLIISEVHIDLVLFGFCTSSLSQENVNISIQQLHSKHLLNVGQDAGTILGL